MLLVSDSLVQREVVRAFDRGFDWLTATGPKIILALILFLAGIWAIKVLQRQLHTALIKKDMHSSLRPFFLSLSAAAMYVALVFLVMEILGIKLTVFAAVIAAFGAAVGLALSGTLQNFASGVLILMLKPFKNGDNVITQGFEGTITSIRIFYTIITTYDNKTVVMPNSKLSNEVIVNITQQGKRRLDMEVSLSHKANFSEVKKILLQIFEELPEVYSDPAPRIGVTAIGKDSYSIISNVWVNAHGFEDSRLLINSRIVDALHAHGLYKE